MMKNMLRTSTAPIAVIRSRRSHPIRALTSLPAGKMVPLAAVPLLREDALDTMSMRLSFEMMETVEVLMNSVMVNVKAYLVPHLAFERFNGMDDLNRSFAGVAAHPDLDVVPYIETAVGGQLGGDWAASEGNQIHLYLGKHSAFGVPVNTAYVEAYNLIWNHRAKNRSPNITPRARLKKDELAPAFWQHEQFAHIVPDWDQRMMDGAVPLTLVEGRMPVNSNEGQPIRVSTLLAPNVTGSLVLNTDGEVKTTLSDPAANTGLRLADVSQVYAEMVSNGVTVMLSNIEMARKTQAFAKLREQFQGHDDEYIIDLLMDGLTIPEQAFQQPILLAEEMTVFGMSKRYASDGGNLTQSVVNGQTFIDLRLRTPRVPMGGVVMVVAEIVPEQLFERTQDVYLHLTDSDKMPHYMRDTLDPEKVEVVRNGYIDVAHGSPLALFGYAPLNHKWNYNPPQVGGKFFRPAVNSTFDEERLRIWAVENEDPVLSEDFYIVTDIHTKPFVMTEGDPFEVVVRGDGVISGNTVFGDMLFEASDNWDKVVEQIDQTRIDKTDPV